MITNENILLEAKRVFELERNALESVENSLDDAFVNAIRLILSSSGNVIFSGVGKSGHVARKLAATLSSTGTTSYFVHADEAAHGDMGMIRRGDVFVAISFSGESDEILMCVPALKAMQVPIITITGKPTSSLAKLSDIALIIPIEREACPLNLAPTSSTTVTMALGDAIAGVLMVAKNFRKEDFAKSHPAGSLGRRLLLKTGDVMRRLDKVPLVMPDTLALDALSVMSKKHLGCFVVQVDNVPVGIFTEGDLTRLLKSNFNFQDCIAKDIMTTSPKVINQESSAFDALSIINTYRINQLVVVNDEKKVVGILHVQDLIAAKVY